jgi:hypothetical protein
MADSNDMRDWAGNVWGNIEKRREDEREKNRTFVAQEERIKRDTPALWSQARATMKAMCDAFNARGGTEQLMWDSERGNQAVIRIEPSSRSFSAMFDLESLRLQLDTNHCHETYTPVLRDGVVLFSGAGRTSTAEELAKHFLDRIVKFIA